ncbi:bifunctional diguanylate cyclase/phosphodiesterase [Viridibacterium curvum]|uniref:EAL domain-containing protein n=1 Tax=Viridibacterium curvum TaxID=1101404 RepID=A0ABP9QRE1_9RHOO
MAVGSPHGFRNAFRVAVLGATTAIALVAGLCAYALYESHKRYCENAEHVALSLSQSLETFLVSHFQSIDLALQSAGREFTRLHAQGRFSEAEFSRYLISLRERLPFAVSVRGADHEGMVVYGEQIDRARLVSQHDREFFQRARDTGKLTFGVPVISRLTGEELFPIVMPLRNPDGSFAGTANVNTSTRRMQEVFSSVRLGEHGNVSLLDRDRRLLVRYPRLEKVRIGTVVPASSATSEAAFSGGAKLAVFSSRNRLDNFQRINVLRRVGDYPIFVIVGLAEEDFLAPWRTEVLVVSVVFSVFCLLTLMFCFNIRRRWRAEVALQAMHASRAVHENLRTLLAAIPDSIFEVGRHGQEIALANERAVNILPPDIDPQGKHLKDLLSPEAMKVVLAAIDQASVRGVPVSTQIMVPHKDGPHWYELSIASKDRDNANSRLIVVSRDITERKQVQAQIEQLAFSDLLTMLPNRRLFMDRLRQSMASSQRSGCHGAVLFLDLDHFKTVNDTLGHQYGDELLVQVASRLRHIVREEDTVARLGGDEFVVILEQLSASHEEASSQAMVVGEKIVSKLAGDYDLRGRHYTNTVSVGVTLFLGHELTVEDLLKRADTSMYQAKNAGRNDVRFFDPATQASIEQRSALEAELRHAAVHQEFVLHYQPQLDAQGHCVGAEALIRWHHPKRGIVPPMEFIPVAEESGLILLIGHWVIAEACRRLQAWATDPTLSQLKIAVNVSARQFAHPNFVREVEDLIAYFNANPERLVIEVTESMLVSGEDCVIARMNELRDMGIGFALDDFGTGYSSLAYLKRMPLSEIKIDRSFTDDILTDPYDSAICNAILAISRTMDLRVVAEGIETLEQWNSLRDAGCHFAQGYYFARPMPEADFVAWLMMRNARTDHP